VKRKLKSLLVVLGLAWGLVFSGFFFNVWYKAYENKYQVVVNVNSKGEARIELVVFPVMMLVIAVAFVVEIIELRKQRGS
jgi:hypothetical protein